MDDIEMRLAAIEKDVAEMKARRARLIPAELDNDPDLQEMMREHTKSVYARAVAGWRASKAQNNLSAKSAEFEILKQAALRQMEEAHKNANEKEAAELMAAIEFYEKTGQSPEGYEFHEADPQWVR